jgi:hypothetical protein
MSRSIDVELAGLFGHFRVQRAIFTENAVQHHHIPPVDPLRAVRCALAGID